MRRHPVARLRRGRRRPAAGAHARRRGPARGGGGPDRGPRRPARCRLDDVRCRTRAGAGRRSVPGPRFAIAKRPAGRGGRAARRAGRGGDRASSATGPSSARSATSGSSGSQGDWFGVPVAELPNGDLGWIRDDRDAGRALRDAATRSSPTSPSAGSSSATATGCWRRFPVTVGAPGLADPARHLLDHRRARGRGRRSLLRLLHPRPHRPPAEPAARLDRRRPDRDPRHPGRDRDRRLGRLPRGPATWTWSRSSRGSRSGRRSSSAPSGRLAARLRRCG